MPLTTTSSRSTPVSRHPSSARDRPDWADLPLTAGRWRHQQRRFRLGDDLLMRMPRTPGGVGSLRKDAGGCRASRLRCRSASRSRCTPGPQSDLSRWTGRCTAGSTGPRPRPTRLPDWARVGADLAGVRSMICTTPTSWAPNGRASELVPRRQPARPERGGALVRRRPAAGAPTSTSTARAVVARGPRAARLPAPHVWLQANCGRATCSPTAALHAVIDFGALSVGAPDAEHAAIWTYPPDAAAPIGTPLPSTSSTLARARAWAIAVAISGIPTTGTPPGVRRRMPNTLEAILAFGGG